MKQTLKKAAMFGLDARIALAIFGALSVISGAALYRAIQNAQATALIADLNEIGKAWESYYLDTGSQLPRASENTTDDAFYYLISNNLIVDPGLSGWKGPYLSYEPLGGFIKHPKYNAVSFFTLGGSLAWGGIADWTGGKCTSGVTCSNYIMINGVASESLLTTVDEILDDSDGAAAGGFRWYFVNDASLYRVFMKYGPIKNPND